MSAPDIYGAAEAVELLGISRARLYQLLQTDKAFPKGTILAAGVVWDGPELRAYDRDRRAPKQARASAILRTYRATGKIKTTARATGYDVKTVRKALREVGEIPPAPDPPEIKANAGASMR